MGECLTWFVTALRNLSQYLWVKLFFSWQVLEDASITMKSSKQALSFNENGRLDRLNAFGSFLHGS